jgi:hypothetical protein
MIPAEKVINNKVVQLIEIYNFYFFIDIFTYTITKTTTTV